MKYYLGTSNENEDHFVTITKVIEDAHDSTKKEIDRKHNKFINLNRKEFENNITCIEFSYRNEKDLNE